MKFRKTVVGACIALGGAAAFAPAAFAQSAIAGTGLYVGGSVGSSHWKGDTDLGGTADDRSDTGGKVYGGYSFTPNFALEFGYASLGKFNGPVGDAKADGYFLDAVGSVPLGNNFSALARLGAFNGKVRSDSPLSDDGRHTNIKGGLGLQYDFNPNFAIRTEWERYRFDTFDGRSNADMYSVGLNYKF